MSICGKEFRRNSKHINMPLKSIICARFPMVVLKHKEQDEFWGMAAIVNDVVISG